MILGMAVLAEALPALAFIAEVSACDFSFFVMRAKGVRRSPIYATRY
jgi:hypothetical protein